MREVRIVVDVPWSPGSGRFDASAEDRDLHAQVCAALGSMDASSEAYARALMHTTLAVPCVVREDGTVVVDCTASEDPR